MITITIIAIIAAIVVMVAVAVAAWVAMGSWVALLIAFVAGLITAGVCLTVYFIAKLIAQRRREKRSENTQVPSKNLTRPLL
jgi:predicted Na+-dependent transporter